MLRRTDPQMSPNLFKSIAELDAIKKGTRVYLLHDTKKTHWSQTMYTIERAVERGMMVKDTNGKILIIEDWDSLKIYTGHIESKEHAVQN